MICRIWRQNHVYCNPSSRIKEPDRRAHPTDRIKKTKEEEAWLPEQERRKAELARVGSGRRDRSRGEVKKAPAAAVQAAFGGQKWREMEHALAQCFLFGGIVRVLLGYISTKYCTTAGVLHTSTSTPANSTRRFFRFETSKSLLLLV